MFAIRPLTADDTKAAAKLIMEDHQYYDEELPDIEKVMGWINPLPAGVEILVTENTESHELVGFAGFSTLYPGPNTGPQIFLKEMYVTEKYRSQGVGRLLFLEVLKIARQRNCQRVDWVTGADNTAAQKFYDSLHAQQLPKIFYRLANNEIDRVIDQLTKGPKARISS